MIMKNKQQVSMALIAVSIIALILAAIVSLGKQEIWLAGTQWILISILTAVYAVYLNGCSCGTDKS